MTQAITRTICRQCCSSMFDNFGVVGVGGFHLQFDDEACRDGCGSTNGEVCTARSGFAKENCFLGIDFQKTGVTFDYKNISSKDESNPIIVPQIFCGLDGTINLVSFSPTKAPVPTNEPTEFPTTGSPTTPTVLTDSSASSTSFLDGPGLIGVIVVGIVVVLGGAIVAFIVSRAPKKSTKPEASHVTSPSGARMTRIAETPEPPPDDDEPDPFPNRANLSPVPSANQGPRYAINDLSMDHLEARSTAASTFLPPAPKGIVGTRLDAVSVVARDKLKNKKTPEKEEDKIIFVAEFDFDAEYPDELSVKKGDLLIGIGAIDVEWWMIRNAQGDEGMVPVSYLSKRDATNHKMSLPYSL